MKNFKDYFEQNHRHVRKSELQNKNNEYLKLDEFERKCLNNIEQYKRLINDANEWLQREVKNDNLSRLKTSLERDISIEKIRVNNATVVRLNSELDDYNAKLTKWKSILKKYKEGGVV